MYHLKSLQFRDDASENERSWVLIFIYYDERVKKLTYCSVGSNNEVVIPGSVPF